jgi:hypothetical protein
MVLLGTYLVAAAFLPAVGALAATLTLVIIFSTPGVIGWDHNILYNVERTGSAAIIGAFLLVSAVLAAMSTIRSDTTTNRESTH